MPAADVISVAISHTNPDIVDDRIRLEIIMSLGSRVDCTYAAHGAV
jgi:hypothetical protein